LLTTGDFHNTHLENCCASYLFSNSMWWCRSKSPCREESYCLLEPNTTLSHLPWATCCLLWYHIGKCERESRDYYTIQKTFDPSIEQRNRAQINTWILSQYKQLLDPPV
jgi:hypothetical protein